MTSAVNCRQAGGKPASASFLYYLRRPVVKLPFAERRAFSLPPAYPADPIAPKAVLFLDDE
jgi:hypothetical protein